MLALIVRFLACGQSKWNAHEQQMEASSPWLGRRVKQGFRGYPVATIAFCGLTEELATKVVVGIFNQEHGDADSLEKWFSQNSDIRSNYDIAEELVEFIKSHEVKSVVVTDDILAVPTKKVSTTLRANPAPSARIGLAATAGRGSEFNSRAYFASASRLQQ